MSEMLKHKSIKSRLFHWKIHNFISHIKNVHAEYTKSRETLFPAKEIKYKAILIQGSKNPINFHDNKLLSIS